MIGIDEHLPECEEQDEDKPCICDDLLEAKRDEEANALIDESRLEVRDGK